MTIIIGGRQAILRQIPEEVQKAFPRLAKPLSGEEAEEMLQQSLEVLQDENMKGSHTVFCDFVRLILALQLSVAESKFQ